VRAYSSTSYYLNSAFSFSVYATDDYGKKYPPDLIYEEMGPNARAWRMYLDECTIFDGDMSEANRDTLDVLLVFVRGLSEYISWVSLNLP
jgi:hypothetical protein